MKKKFFGVACILALSGVLTTGQILTNKRNALTNLENANIEALTGGNGFVDFIEDAVTLGRCWDPKFAIHQKIYTVYEGSGTFTLNAEGKIYIEGEAINVGFNRGINIPVSYCKKDCQASHMSCCNQNKVGLKHSFL